ncbi:hypothetical protein [Paenibacillus methanolicus]|uniref:Uncharacterized protein n=1 Tax=Paenibacillus methanolicus TaxID=582686 RepID=A0A5S5C5V2_9BACL|nr:hypothetical protein [Paenibacillus methanolicus]TYP74697.1 hypothetical protein BCM02_105241 [Paenibacillus methanolicus]
MWDGMLITTIALLGASFLALGARMTGRTGRTVVAIAFAALAFLLLYSQYDDWKGEYEDANIGLGLAYMLVWGATAVAIVGAVIGGGVKGAGKRRP